MESIKLTYYFFTIYFVPLFLSNVTFETNLCVLDLQEEAVSSQTTFSSSGLSPEEGDLHKQTPSM